MKLLPSEVSAIEEATRGQSANELWFALRNPRRWVRDIMGYGGPMKCLPPQIRWGQENEEEACKRYVENRQNVGEVMIVKKCGLHLLLDKSYLGASSDGLVTCTSDCQGCLEIKCPTLVTKLLPLKCHQWKLLTDLETNSW